MVAEARCPNCRSTTIAAYRPFCSKRCADLDLGRWLTGGYAIPGASLSDEDVADAGTDHKTDDRQAAAPGPLDELPASASRRLPR